MRIIERARAERTTKPQDRDIAGGVRETGARVASTLQPLSSTPAIAEVTSRDIDASIFRHDAKFGRIQAYRVC